MRTRVFRTWLLTVMTGVMLSFAVRAENVPFMFFDEQTETMKESVCTDGVQLTDGSVTWWDGFWYIADGDVSIGSRVKVNGSAYLILKDGCVLTVNEGITVGEGAALTIFAQSDGENMGRLEVGPSSADHCAGIGGGGGRCGDITIHGGNLTANAKNGTCAAIGGGSDGGGFGSITINGGVIFANGGKNAAGIGGSGSGGLDGVITIRGGEITTRGGYGLVGIGGYVNWQGTINISGGSLTAEGGNAGYGISCQSNSNGTLNVADDILLFRNDGTQLVKGDGQTWDDLLGGNEISFYTKPVTPEQPKPSVYLVYDAERKCFVETPLVGATEITEGMNTLTDGLYYVKEDVELGSAVGINGDVRIVLADDRQLLAHSFTVNSEQTLRIYAQSVGEHAGKLVATGATNSEAGIGGGYKRDGGSVIIDGGSVEAVSGYFAAGIGGGRGANGGDVHINGGEVTAFGRGSVAIGRGDDGHSDGSLTVEKHMRVLDDFGVDVTGGDYFTYKKLHFVPSPIPVLPYDQRVKYAEYIDGKKTVKDGAAFSVYPKLGTFKDAWYVATGELTMEEIFVEGDVHLILSDGCRLTVKNGIHVPADARLTIYGGEEGTGVLLSEGHGDSAGIGGTTDNGGGSITVHGGNITAIGGENGGAGIGGGYYYVGCDYDPIDWVYDLYDHGAAGDITIYGGNINATGGYCAAGVGGGYGCSGGHVTVYGGVVTANGGELPYVSNIDNADGVGNGWFDVLDEDEWTVLVSDEVPGGEVNVEGGMIISNGGKIHPVHTFAGEYTDNGNGTHSQKCIYCDEKKTESHSCVTSDKCVCGADKFDIDENGALIRYYGADEVVNIPDGVKRIAGVFNGSRTIKKVIIPASVEIIDWNAFFNSTLAEVEFAPDAKLTTVVYGAFTSSQLTSFTVPKSVKDISDSSIGGMKTLAALSFEEGSQIENIGDWAFSGDGLTELDLPPSLKTIGRYAFDGMDIASVTVHWTKESDLPQIGGSVFKADVFQNGVLHIPEGTLTLYENHPFFGQFANIDEPTPDHEHDYTDGYADNLDGTHTQTCGICGLSFSVPHRYHDGVCVCGAAGGVIGYLCYDADTGAFAEKSCGDYADMCGKLEDGVWYVAKGTCSFGNVKVNGDAHLILADGCKLTAGSVTGDGHLHIYAESDGENIGSFTASGFPAFELSSMTIHGGNITGNGGTERGQVGGTGIKVQTLTVYGGEVSGIGGTGSESLGGGGSGYKGGGGIIADSLYQYGGSIAAVGGIGGSGSSDKGGAGGKGAVGLSVTTMKLYDGRLTAAGGAGGMGVNYGNGGDGAVGLSATTINAYGGSITASGGMGGKGADVEHGTSFSGDGGEGGAGISAQDIYMQNADITATGGAGNVGGSGAQNGSFGGNGEDGMKAQTLVIKGGSLHTTGGNGGGGRTAKYGGDGLEITKLTVRGGSITAEGGASGMQSSLSHYGVSVRGKGDFRLDAAVSVKGAQYEQYILLPEGKTVSDYRFALLESGTRVELSLAEGVYTVTANGADEGYVIAAVYDGDGRMTDVKIYDIENGDEMTGTVTDGARVKAFLVTKSLEPLCEAAEA